MSQTPNNQITEISTTPASSSTSTTSTTAQENQNANEKSLSCLSYNLIGLAPSFWSYNPFLITTIHNNILLIHGINVFLLLDEKSPVLNQEGHKGVVKKGTGSNSTCSTSTSSPSSSKNTSSSPTDPNNGSKMNINVVGNKCNHKNDIIVQTKHAIPISKVEIVGIVQYVHYKSNRSINMIVDDGTAFIDCIYWWNDDYDDDETLNQIIRLQNNNLKSEKELGDDYDTTSNNSFQVGDLVRVQGQLKVLSIDHNTQLVVRVQNNCKDSFTKWEAYGCHREIQIHSIDKVDDLTEETLHWLKSLRFIKQVENTRHIRQQLENNIEQPKNIGLHGHVKEVDNDLITDEDFCSYYEGWQDRYQLRCFNTPILDGLDIYNTLSKKMKYDLLQQNNINDNNGNCNGNFAESETKDQKLYREYHGRKCHCHKSVKHMKELAYCHCIASKEVLDENFHFRDALLAKLLQMETSFYEHKGEVECSDEMEKNGNICHEQQNEKKESSKFNICNHNSSPKQKGLENNPYFCFHYNTVYQDSHLQSIAQQTVSKTSDPTTNLRRLYINTFFHLRNDGVLYLEDREKDLYVLLSMKHVLIPIMDDFISKEEQRYFSNHIRNQKQSNTSKANHDDDDVDDDDAAAANNNNNSTNTLVYKLPSFLNHLTRRKFNFLKNIVENQRNK